MCEWMAPIVLAAVSVGLAFLALLLVRGPLRQILSVNSLLAQARPFYTRALFLVLAFGALAAVARTGPLSAKDWQPMQYVWWVFNNLEGPFWSIAIFLFGYVIALTILYSVLGRHRDE